MSGLPQSSPTKHARLNKWIDDVVELTQPDRVVWANGSKEEYDGFAAELVAAGQLRRLNPELWPDSYAAFTDASDTARVVERTFIASDAHDPDNNWAEPVAMRAKLDALLEGCMRGRTMYVIPFSMGPIGGPGSYIGIEITDSAYVVMNMRIMTRMGTAALAALGDEGEFVRCLHSVGVPLEPGQADMLWPCRPIDEKYIVQFPDTREIISFGSGYGGNALLGKKCFALRIGSVIARDEGWLAEHAAIVKVTNPKGKELYFTASFPSACGKTNFAMLIPSIPGWKVDTIGDDICWLRFGADGRLWAINPEAGFFGVAPGTGEDTNPNAVATLRKGGVIFTNVGITPDGDVWWEGLSDHAPAGLIDWQGNSYDPASGNPAAQANSRFTAPATNCPSFLEEEWNDPNGVPISGMLFGGRRPSVVPLVTEATSWPSGVLRAATLASETTAASIGEVGQLKFDPSAMRPFFGYPVADYYAHWLSIGAKADQTKLPVLFAVNWFRKENGKFLWPGFGDNARVLKWAFERIAGTAEAQGTPLGFVPTIESLDLEGLDICDDHLNTLLSVDTEGWLREIPKLRVHLDSFGPNCPKTLNDELDLMEERFLAFQH